MLTMFNYALRRLGRDEGATAVEYGLMVALIAVVIIGSVVFLGDILDEAFDLVGSEIQEGTELEGPD